MPVYNSFIVMHKVQQDNGIQVCEIGKPEDDTIMNDKAISEKRRYTHIIKPKYDNGDKGIDGLQGD